MRQPIWPSSSWARRREEICRRVRRKTWIWDERSRIFLVPTASRIGGVRDGLEAFVLLAQSAEGLGFHGFRAKAQRASNSLVTAKAATYKSAAMVAEWTRSVK